MVIDWDKLNKINVRRINYLKNMSNVNKDIRQLREKLRKVYSEITTDFYEVILKIDKTLVALEEKDV